MRLVARALLALMVLAILYNVVAVVYNIVTGYPDA